MMKKNLNGAIIKRDAAYREESTRLPFVVLVLSLVLVTLPLVWVVLRVDSAGAAAADVSKYNVLVQTVGVDLRAVNTMLTDGSERFDIEERTDTLIVSEVVIVDEVKPDDSPKTLNVELKGIYWNPTRPLVDIDNETYYVGDKVQGYTIVEIGKTNVHFKAKDGTIVVKDFYENLLQSK